MAGRSPSPEPTNDAGHPQGVSPGSDSRSSFNHCQPTMTTLENSRASLAAPPWPNHSPTRTERREPCTAVTFGVEF